MVDPGRSGPRWISGYMSIISHWPEYHRRENDSTEKQSSAWIRKLFAPKAQSGIFFLGAKIRGNAWVEKNRKTPLFCVMISMAFWATSNLAHITWSAQGLPEKQGLALPLRFSDEICADEVAAASKNGRMVFAHYSQQNTCTKCFSNFPY